MEKILLIDNYDSFTYNLLHYIEAEGKFKVDVFRNDEINLNEVEKYQSIILSPGPGLPENAGITKSLIEKYAPTKKILGVCLGMQAIGEVFGADLENLKEVYHGVSHEIKIIDTSDKLFQNLPPNFFVGRYHSWIVSKNNFPASLIATSMYDNEQIMSLRHREYMVYGVQFHPESILTAHGKEIIQNFLEI